MQCLIGSQTRDGREPGNSQSFRFFEASGHLGHPTGSVWYRGSSPGPSGRSGHRSTSPRRDLVIIMYK